MAEYRTLHKWFWVWDFEKEERWLNEMALQGWTLSSVGWCKYVFERTEPGEYTVKTELNSPDASYLRFLGEADIEYLGNVVAWAYYRKKSALGSFEIFSDIDSKIQHLNKIGKMLSVIGFANLLIGLVNTFSPARAGWINLLCACVLMYALGRIHGKKEALENERLLHE